MSKLSFRARALDAAKPLPVYRSRDLPDLNDCVSINRAVPQMPTGMEKEEELVWFCLKRNIILGMLRVLCRTMVFTMCLRINVCVGCMLRIIGPSECTSPTYILTQFIHLLRSATEGSDLSVDVTSLFLRSSLGDWRRDCIILRAMRCLCLAAHWFS